MTPEEKHFITKIVLDWLKRNYVEYDHRDEFDIQGLLVDFEYYLTHKI